MEIFSALMAYFGINALNSQSTFTDFIQYLFAVLLAVYIICFVFKCLFQATFKIGRDLR